jgi:hypothetical protein
MGVQGLQAVSGGVSWVLLSLFDVKNEDLFWVPNLPIMLENF